MWLDLLFSEAVGTVKSHKFQMFSGYTHKPTRNVVIVHVGSPGSSGLLLLLSFAKTFHGASRKLD